MSVRKLDSETRKEVASHLQLNAKKKLVQQSYREKTGKNILSGNPDIKPEVQKGPDTVPEISRNNV